MTTRQITLDISDKALPAEKMDEASKESPMITAGTPILGDGVFSTIHARKHRDFESRGREVGRLDVARRLEGAPPPATILLLPALNEMRRKNHKLVAGQGDYAGANPEDSDEYKAENVFCSQPRPESPSQNH